MELRRLVEDLVHRHADEVEELQLDDRADPGDREADPEADGGRLAERTVADDLAAEALPEPARNAERASVGADVLPEVDHQLVAGERLGDGAVDRLAEGQLDDRAFDR